MRDCLSQATIIENVLWVTVRMTKREMAKSGCAEPGDRSAYDGGTISLIVSDELVQACFHLICQSCRQPTPNLSCKWSTGEAAHRSTGLRACQPFNGNRFLSPRACQSAREILDLSPTRGDKVVMRSSQRPRLVPAGVREYLEQYSATQPQSDVTSYRIDAYASNPLAAQVLHGFLVSIHGTL